LVEVAACAAELNDPYLDALMCRLQLYLQSDPENKEYDPKATNETIQNGMLVKNKKAKPVSVMDVVLQRQKDALILAVEAGIKYEESYLDACKGSFVDLTVTKKNIKDFNSLLKHLKKGTL
jgi:hypothetical protein